jgi:hypothetical protein
VQALCPGITATEFLEVAETHRGLDRGRTRVVASRANRLLAFVVQRLAPRALARRVAAELYRPCGRAQG